MKFPGSIFFLLSACCAAIACGRGLNGPHLGGACEYRQFNGQATITDVRHAETGAGNCRNAVEVVFTFSPDEPSSPEQYRFPQQPDSGQYLRVGAGMNPSRAWTRSKGLLRGSVHRCIRSEILKGACTPVVFTFPDIDMADWAKACFK